MTKTINIEGMSCMHCACAVKDELEKLAGVNSVAVNLEGKTAVVETSAPLADDALRAAVEEAGYEVMSIG